MAKKFAGMGSNQAPKKRRVSFTVPVSLHEDLEHVARQLGVSRSALASSLLEGVLTPLVASIGDLPIDNPSPDDVLRMRGRSVEVIEEKLELVRSISAALEGTDSAK